LTPPSQQSDGDQVIYEPVVTRKKTSAVEVVNHFVSTYGQDEGKLAAWQKFCEDLGVSPQPSITKCKKALKGIHVNLVDFVAAQDGGPPFKLFLSQAALRKYIKTTPGKVFPKKKAKQSFLLKFMLIEV
ncbi:hypothetical protein BAUCODRAFT_41083, partial [Baudoinia panamericana UAMH 10762]